MGNMSYCRFKNTSDDLKDCNKALGEMDFPDFEELSESEQEAVHKLFTLCKNFVEIYKQNILPEINKE
jgi:hypothetical protein